MSSDYSGLKLNDTLEQTYKSNGNRLPVNPIPDEIKPYKSFDLKTIKEKYHG